MKSERLRVRDLMSDDPVAVRADESVETAMALMADLRIRHLPVVVEGAKVVGLISHRDLAAAGGAFGASVPPPFESSPAATIGEVMTRQVATIGADSDVQEAATLMLERKIGCLPVVEDGRLVGIVTESDFVRLLARGQ